MTHDDAFHRHNPDKALQATVMALLFVDEVRTVLLLPFLTHNNGRGTNFKHKIMKRKNFGIYLLFFPDDYQGRFDVINNLSKQNVYPIDSRQQPDKTGTGNITKLLNY